MDRPRPLHVLYTFYPDLTGSSVRSAGILRGQALRDFDPIAITSPFQPGFSDAAVEEFAGVPVYRTYRQGNPRISEAGSRLRDRLRKVLLFPSFTRTVYTVAKTRARTHIHAHSTFYCALAAWIAARLLGVRYVYEVRSLWEERARNLGLLYRIQSRVSRLLETFAARRADHVVVISNGLRESLLRRGVRPDRIAVVPNAVDDEVLEQGLRLSPPDRVKVFSYIGNLSSIEGLDLLVAAFRQAFEGDGSVSLRFFGGGPFEPALRSLVETAGDARVTLEGRFGRDDLLEIYRKVDAVVLPRRRLPITEIVTPIKPLEAMAFRRLVLVSDVAGLEEVVGDRQHAVVLRADDVDDLARALRAVASGKVDVRATAEAGARFVHDRRAWTAVASTYEAVYVAD